MNDLVSIIVPVYDVEMYLHECLDSLIHQTYDNIEIIVVDDGSPDKSPAICDQYAELDNRVSVYHVKNGGVSRARNFGVTKAKGEWIMFLDSDDFLALDAIAILLQCGTKYDVDIVSCAFYNTFMNRNIISGKSDGEFIIQTFKTEEFIHDMIVYPHKALSIYPTCLVPWGKIIKRSLLLEQKLTFPLDLHPHEDALFNVELFKSARTQAYVHNPLLYYRQRRNSSTKSKTKDNFSNNKRFCEYIKMIYNNHGECLFSSDEYAVTCCKYYVYGMTNLWAFSGWNKKIAREQLLKYMDDELFSVQLDKAIHVDISQYGFSNRLSISIDAARKRKVNKLLLYARISNLRATIKENNPIHGTKIFP